MEGTRDCGLEITGLRVLGSQAIEIFKTTAVMCTNKA